MKNKILQKWLCIFVATPDEVEKHVEIMQSISSDNFVHRYNFEILNLFHPDLQLINTKPMIKNQLNELLSELKKVNVHAILVLWCKKISYSKTFHSCTKLIASDSAIDEVFKSMHQRIMTKIKNDACEDWIVLDVMMKHSIKILSVSIRRINSIRKWRY